MDSSLRFENMVTDFDILKDKVTDRMKSPNGEFVRGVNAVNLMADSHTTANIDRLIAEGDVLLQSMLIELKKAPILERSDLQRAYDTRMREWQNLKRSLVLGSAPASSSSGMSANERWQQGHKIMQDTNNSVFRAQQIAQENESIGTEVVTELGVQREALVRTRDRLTDANEDLTRTNKILRSMNRRVLTNKCLLIVIILLELAILSGVVYVRFIRSKT